MSGEVKTVVRSDIGRYAIVPEWLLATDISANAIRLFAVLAAKYADRDGVAYPSRRRLREDMGGVSLDTVDRSVSELVKIGAITVESRRSEDGDPASNLYTLHFVRSGQGVLDLPIGSRTHAATPEQQSGDGSRTHAATVAAPMRPKPEPVEPEPNEPKLSRAPRAVASVEIPTKLPTPKQIEREQHRFGKAAEDVWRAAAAKAGSPYVTRGHLRQVHELAIGALRWATEAQVLAAIARRLDAKSAPVRIPEWARLEAADAEQRAHADRMRRVDVDEVIEPGPRVAGLRPIGAAAAAVVARAAS